MDWEWAQRLVLTAQKTSSRYLGPGANIESSTLTRLSSTGSICRQKIGQNSIGSRGGISRGEQSSSSSDWKKKGGKKKSGEGDLS